ncbi:MAG TPA: regulator [Magnetococcales bacterium]|nr:regulator [Magnetococcales bacterium]
MGGHPGVGTPGHSAAVSIPSAPQGEVAVGGQPAKDDAAKGKFTHFRVGNRNVKSMYAKGDNVWVGTSGGVIRYDINKDDYRLFDVRNGSLLANGVFHVGPLGKDIAVGTYGGGLSLFDPATEKWTSYNIPQGLADAFVYDTMKVANGDVWIATWSGANHVVGGNLQDQSQWRTYTVENTKGGLPNDWVYGLAEGLNGDVWLATEGGLALFRNGQWKHWTHKDGVGAPYEQVKGQNTFDSDPGAVSSHHARQKQEQGLGHVTTAYNPNYIISLASDGKGGVWCGTWGAGLAHFDGEKWTNLTKDNGLPANHIFMLRMDEKNRLWVGTSAGMALRNADGTFSVRTTTDGLFSNNVFSMAFSPDGSQWVGSYGGVARLLPEK